MREKEQDKGNQAASNSGRKDGLEQTHYAEYKVPDEDVPANKCHQCQRNKGRIVRCERCTKWDFYDRWATEEEPRIKQEKFSVCCPLCCDSCNCISCPPNVRPKALRCEICNSIFCYHKLHSKDKKKIDLKPNDDQKVQYSLYILHVLVPILKRINDEHIKEKEIESKIQGSSLLEVQLKKANFDWCQGMLCACCKTSFFDLHKSCTSCHYYNLCLKCCWELRDGNLQGNKEKQTDEWKCLDDGRIPCPPESMGGCGHGILDLMHIKPIDSIPELLNKAQKLLEMHKLEDDMREIPEKWCSCSDGGDEQLRKAASRENSDDNDLYSPRAIDIKEGDLKHFQWHWSKGEPVIVSNVLETSLGLIADPMVMSRAFFGIYQYKRESSTKFIEYREKYKTKSKIPKHDCDDKYRDMTPRRSLDWCEVDVTLQKFFAWYSEGMFDAEGWPTFDFAYKKDWPLRNLLEERLLLVGVEFITSLPFKEYTSPREGYLNLAVKLPKKTLKPEIAPKIYIAYALNQELGRGDSVTKLHCEKSDVVNVLVNIPPVTPNRKRINELKKQQKAIDKTQDATSEKVGLNKQKGTPGICVDGSDEEEGGAVWDIFRREDTSKLQEYLNKHFKEFKDDSCQPLKQVIHPIHGQTFYLTVDHKRKLKEEFGIEPWTYVQKLGDAVFIPAGCPHQVRNLKSCIKVALDFVSPENVGECIRLTEDFRLLPKNHRAKEDTLEVKKIALYAVEAAVEDLEKIVPKNSPYLGNSQDHPHAQYHENSPVSSNANQVPIPQNLQPWQNMIQNKKLIDHDTTHSRPEYNVGNEGSGGIMKRYRTSEEGNYSVHFNPHMPNSGCPPAHCFIGTNIYVSEKKGKGKVSQPSSSTNEFISQLRAIRFTRDNEVEAMKKRHAMEQKNEEREVSHATEHINCRQKKTCHQKMK